MHYVVYFILALTPIAIFPLLALPVEKYQPGHQAALIIVYITNLIIPLVHAGQYSVAINTISGCFAFASSLKMAVWLFCMSQEERRKRPYYIDFWHWRRRQQQQNKPTEEEEEASTVDISITELIKKYLKVQLCFELLELTLTAMDQKKSIRVFWYMVHRMLGQKQNTQDQFSFQTIAISFLVCTLNAAYLQFMMQTTYNACMIVFSVLYHLIPGHAGFRQYFEELLDMPPMFDTPWEATSLRDYWSNRWHTFYNMSFYRLAFKPVRWICDKVPMLKPLRRALPTFAVFALSGTMHEYYLYCTAGPETYWGERIGGLQFLFFLLQPVGVVIGDKWFSSGVRGRVFAFVWMIGLSHLFVVPYLVTDYSKMVVARLSPAVTWIVAQLLARANQYGHTAHALVNAMAVIEKA